MARAAKKETPLTTEEKLAKALVPEEEQPYPVPGNWCWVRLGSLYEINPKNEANDELESGFVPMDKISAGMCTSFNFDVQPWVKAKKGHVQFADGDVAFAKISPCFENRKSMIVGGLPNGIGAGTTEIIVLRQPSVNNRFTFWLISTDDFIQKGRRTYSGTVGQQRISMDYVRQYPIPLPPLPEQQRIVTLIDSLFADLDATKKKLQAVLDGFAQRRAALLHQAFTGELTREWREKKEIRDDSWVEKKLEDCGNWSGGGTPSMNHPEYWDDGSIRWVTSKDMKAEIINDTQMHITAMGEQNSSAKLINSCAVLFVTRSGILRRTLPIAMISGKFTVNQDLKVLEPENNIDTKYLLRACQAREKRILDTCMKSGTTVESINFSALKTFVISVCSLPEQKEIVRILDDIFAKESQSKAAVESALAEIETMKKTILATAFRGGFETNNSSDESAEELLRKVL